MVRVCAVKSCPSGRKSKKVEKETSCSVSFFQAKTPARLQHWTKSLGIALKASDYICQFHFKEKDIKMYTKIVIGNKVHLHHLVRKDLTEEAVPTIEHQLQLNPQLQQQDQQQLEQEQQQSEQEQLQPEQEQLQSEQEQQQLDQEQQQSEQEQLQPEQEQLQSEQEQQQLEQEQQQLEQEQQQPEQIPEIVKPISYFRKKLTLLPQHWTYAEKPDAMEFIRIDPVRMQIENHIASNEDFFTSVIFTNFKKFNLNDKLSSPDKIFDYLKSVEKWPLCVRTQTEKQRYSNEYKRVIIGDEAYQRNQINPRCKSCRVLRSRLQSCDSTDIKLQKSVARKRRTVNVIKQCKRLKTTKLKLRQVIFDAKAKCARKSKLFVQEAIKELPPEFQIVVTSCFEAAQKQNAKGRRYTLEWLYECIIIRLKSRNTYELLRARKILPLPSLSTLNKYIKKISCSAYGFQSSTFEGLKEKFKSEDEQYKRGSILVDEMKLSENIYFDTQTMKFNGFVDLGQHTPDELKNKTADHALVFKFVPFRGRWTQALGCFLSKSACTTVPLHKLIIECIVLLENSGIHADSVVTDGATWNRGVWKILNIEENNVSCEHPCNSNQRLWMISDFNHLTKNFRTGIINGKSTDFKTPYGIVKKKHWESVIAEENYYQPNLKIAHKLTPAHLNPKGFQKMNVPLANQLFGHEVSVAMAHYQSTCDDLADSSPIQKFIDLMYNLIQAMSSRIPRDALYIKDDCRQRQAILKFLAFLKDWEKLGPIPVSKSTLVGLKVTLQATLQILDALHTECNYNYLMTATLSQDPLERFFSIMRFSCGGKDHPDPKMFAQVYRLASCFSLIKPPKGCNVDGVHVLKTILKTKDFMNNQNTAKQEWLESINSMLDNSLPMSLNSTHEDDHNYNEAVTSEAVQSYIAGYIGRKLKKMLKCQGCLQALESKRNDGKLLARNDVINKMYLYGGLFYASDELFVLTKQLEECVLRAVSKSLVNLDTINEITTEISKKNLQTVGCFEHLKGLTRKVIDFYVVMRAHFLAKSENKRYETAKAKVKMHRKNAKLIT